MKKYRGLLFAIEIFTRRDARRVRATAPAVALVIMAALAGIFASGVAQALTADEAKLIDKGFLVFSKEKFNGNGRTCTTCHLPQADFNIGPADIATLSAHQKKLVFGAGIKPGNAGTGSLENSAMVQSLGLFNINDGVGGIPSQVGTGDTPTGPFRASMTIAGLAFTTANLLPDYCSSSSPPQIFEIFGTPNPCSPLPSAFPAPGTPLELFSVFDNGEIPFDPTDIDNDGPNPAESDEGTRNIELGWAGDGAITDPDIFGAIANGANADCRGAVDEANGDPANLTKTLRAFSLTAVKTHFPKSLNRVPGVDFRCPTSPELDAIAAFQEYLGRRFELALAAGVRGDSFDKPNSTLLDFAAGTQTDASQPVITFNDATAETGRKIFLNGNAQCNLCHFNAGANTATGEIEAPDVNDPSAPFPGRNLTSRQEVDLLRCTDITGNPTTCTNGATATTHGLNALVTPVVFPQDPGDKIEGSGVSLAGSDCNKGINNGGNTGCTTSLREGSFNLQPLIEAARKKSFFHNGAFNTLEGAISFYFSPTSDLIKSFKGHIGDCALAALANEFFSAPAPPVNCKSGQGLSITDPAAQPVFNTMGFFLRSLSAVYALADCERLVNDSITLVSLHRPNKLQVMLCSGELDDVERLLAGAQVALPPQYTAAQSAVPGLKSELKSAAQAGDRLRLSVVRLNLMALRHSIATITPDLP
jgi:cytochrome c peroxidase